MLIVEIVEGAVVAVEKLVDRLFFLGKLLLRDGLGFQDRGLVRVVLEKIVGDRVAVPVGPPPRLAGRIVGGSVCKPKTPRRAVQVDRPDAAGRRALRSPLLFVNLLREWRSVARSHIVSFKFLHAADIHLDSPLRGLALSAMIVLRRFEARAVRHL